MLRAYRTNRLWNMGQPVPVDPSATWLNRLKPKNQTFSLCIYYWFKQTIAFLLTNMEMTMKISFKSLLKGFIGIIMILSIGCASIVSKSDYPVTFRSNPSQADIVITDKKGREIYRGKTPATLTLSASSGFFGASRFDIKASKDGFNDVSSSVTAGVDGWYFGNLLFGGLLGILIIDPATGAMYKLPSDHTLNLVEKDADSSSISGPRIVYTTDLPEELRKNLIPLVEK